VTVPGSEFEVTSYVSVRSPPPPFEVRFQVMTPPASEPPSEMLPASTDQPAGTVSVIV